VTACPLPVAGRCVVDGDLDDSDDDDSDDEASVSEAPFDGACEGAVPDVSPRASTELASVPAQAVVVAETNASVATTSVAARRPNGVDLRSFAGPRQT